MYEIKGLCNIPLSEAQILGIRTAVAQGCSVRYHGDCFQIVDDAVYKAIGIQMSIDVPTDKRELPKMMKRIRKNCEDASLGLPSLSVRVMQDIAIPEMAILRINCYS